MIGVKIDGRFGNQLFQYAFALHISQELKCQFFLDQSKYEFAPRQFFELPRFYNFLNSLRARWFYVYKNQYKQVQESDLIIGNNSFYTGFFQSVGCFENSVSMLKSQLRVKKQYVQLFVDKYPSLGIEQYIGIHVRKTDYTHIGHLEGKPVDKSLPKAYYDKCFEQIDNFDHHIKVFVSDDIAWARKAFSEIPNARFVSDTEIIDFQVLMNASKLIIANSSFSWWAAFLNKKSDEVYAPKYWMGYNERVWQPHDGILKGLGWKIVD